MKDPSEVTHPRVREVQVNAGQARVRVKPWTMAQRAELRPRVADLINKIVQLDASNGVDIGAIFMHAEDEIGQIVRLSVDLEHCDIGWDEIWAEDLFILGQAIWEVCVWREEADGERGGYGGKLASVMGGRLDEVARSLLTPQKSPKASAAASPSSPPNGERPQSTSGTP